VKGHQLWLTTVFMLSHKILQHALEKMSSQTLPGISLEH